MKKKFSKEVIIGATVIVALLILFFGIDFLRGINVFKASNYYYVSYTNVNGLAISAPVTVNGYKVGLVREMQYEYDNPGHILVELSLDKQLKVPQGSQAVINIDMLGTATIELKMSDNSTYHNIGDKIEGYTASGLMESVSAELMPSISSIMPKIDSLLTSVNNITSSPALLNSIKRLDNITANLEASSKQLSRMMDNLPPTMKNVKLISDNLNNITGNLNEVSSELKNMPLDSTMSNIYTISENAKELTNKLNSNESSLGLLMNDTQLYNNLNNAAGNLDSLFIDIKKNPKRYISIKLL